MSCEITFVGVFKFLGIIKINVKLLYSIRCKITSSTICKKFQLHVGRRKIPKNKKGAIRLKKIIENWDYYASNQDRFYRLYGDKYLHLWGPKLKDPIYKEYPSYILDYDYELKKIVPTMKRLLNRL